MAAGDEEKVLLGSEEGDVLIVFNGDLRGNLNVDPDAAIKAIVPTSKACFSHDTYQPITLVLTCSILTLFLSRAQLYVTSSDSWQHILALPDGCNSDASARCDCVSCAQWGFVAGWSTGRMSISERRVDNTRYKRVWQATVEGHMPKVLDFLQC